MVGPYRCGRGAPLLVIAGPCVIEDESLTLRIAERLAGVAAGGGIQLVFKASFDKANRTSIDAYRGPGLQRGLEILARVKRETGLPVTTDIHLPSPDSRLLIAADGPTGSGCRDRPGDSREEGAIPCPVGHAARGGQTCPRGWTEYPFM
jgi:hypothetical protein